MKQKNESDVCIFEIRIPLINMKTSVLYSPFHRWEHLFITNLRAYIDDYYEIYGQTDKKETLLTILLSPTLSESINKDIILEILKKDIAPEIINLTLDILDNEISLLSTLMKKELLKYSDIENLNYIDMLRFRENSYDWNNFCITKTLIPKSSFQHDTKESISMQFLLDSKRDELINKFYQDQYNTNKDVQGDKFVLICIPLNGKNDVEIEIIFNNLNDNNGFFKTYFNIRNFYTNVCKPSIEYKNQIFYITLFIFINANLVSNIIKDFIIEIYKITKNDLLESIDTIIYYD